MENKIESLKEISDVCEINSLITKFSVINEFIKQAVMYVSIKKGKKEEILLEELDLFTKKLDEMNKIINEIVSYK